MGTKEGWNHETAGRKETLSLPPIPCSRNPSSHRLILKHDGLVESLLGRHPGEPRIRSGAGAGVQNTLKKLDSGFPRKDAFYRISAFYEFINCNSIEFWNGCYRFLWQG